MKNTRGFQFFTSVKWTGFLLVFYVGLLVWVPAGAEDLKKEEQLQFAQTILREASVEIPNLPNDNFPSFGAAWIQNHKVQLLEKVAKVQGTMRDQEGLRDTADRAIQTAQTHISNIYPLSVIGDEQVKAGFLEDGGKTAEAALEAVRFHKKQRNMDAWLPLIAGVFVRAGNMKKAMESADMMVSETDRAISLQNIGLQETKSGNKEKAEEILAQIHRLMTSLDNPQNQAWYRVYGAKRRFELNRRAEAEQELTRAKTFISGISDYGRRAWLLREIAQLENTMGRREQFEKSVNEVVHAIEMIPDAGSRVAQYADLAQLLSQSSLKARVPVLMSKARHDVLLDEGPSSKMGGLLSLAEGEWKIGQKKISKELVNQAVDALGEVKDSRYIGLALHSFYFYQQASGLLTNDDLNRILRIVHGISNDKVVWKSSALSTLAILQAQHGYFEEAMETINQIQVAPSSRGFPTQHFGKEFVQAKGIEQAIVWAKGLPSKVERIHAHIGIAEGMLETSSDVQEP